MTPDALYADARKDEAGFTLVEVMIAIPVIVLALLGILYANTMVQHASEAAHERVVATQDAHRVIEQMREEATDGEFPGNVTAVYPNGGGVGGFENLTEEEVTVNYENAVANPLDVTVTVTWEDQQGRGVDLSMRTLVTQRNT